jgi:cytochrome c oxidase cbb3-type subunit 1
VLFLFTKAAAWLFLASAIGFIAALKFHGPQKILVDSPWLTYGRLQPAALNALVYGFAIQTGLGVALWLLARLGRTTLVQSGLVLVGGLIWNLGVAAGVFGILIGDSTGYEWLEMPRYASPILFAAYVVIGICGLLTFHRRRERSLYPSQWFLLAALFWFPWIYSVGNLLLVFFPVRGALQAVINWWYLHNLSRVWLGSVGLATIFYFLPKLLGRPLHSAYLAMFALWTLLLFGSMGGIYSGAPLPSWIPGLSTVFTVLSLVSVIAVAVNCDATLAGELGKLKETLPIRFIAVGAAAYVLAGVFGVIDSLPILSRTTHFTFLSPGLTQLFLYGFFAMTMFGAIYYIAPKLAGIDFPSSKMVRWHFSLSAIGFAISFVSLAIAGLLQGQVLNDSTRPFLESLQSGLRLFRLSTLGDLLMLFGNLAIAVNLSWLWCRRYCSGCVTSLLDAAKSEPAEVKP